MAGAGRLGVAAYPCRNASTSSAPAKMAAATSEPARGHESERYSQINMRHEDTWLRRRKCRMFDSIYSPLAVLHDLGDDRACIYGGAKEV